MFFAFFRSTKIVANVSTFFNNATIVKYPSNADKSEAKINTIATAHCTIIENKEFRILDELLQKI